MKVKVGLVQESLVFFDKAKTMEKMKPSRPSSPKWAVSHLFFPSLLFQATLEVFPLVPKWAIGPKVVGHYARNDIFEFKVEDQPETKKE